MTPALKVAGLTVAYQREAVLDGVTFEIERGRLAAIVGPNGAGKTTLLHACLGLVPAASGEVTVLGRSAREALGSVGFVPQVKDIDRDFPVVVLDVVSMGLVRQAGWFKRLGSAHRKRALEALDRVGMADLAQRQIGELSGGQRQRVFVARALVQGAELLLMDEPFTGVDADTEARLSFVMRELCNEGVTSIVVHHNLATVERIFDDVILLNRSVIAHGPVATTFTNDALRETYGGSLLVLPG